MKQELVEIVKNLSEDDIIDVLHNFGEQVEEDGYDSFEVLAELILETRLSDIFDFELILTEAINPRARRILVRNQRASQERLNKNKNRLGKFLSKQFSRLKNLFSKKKPENKGPVRGRDYHYDFPVTSTRSRSARSARNRGSSSPSTTQQPPLSRGSSGSSRRLSDDDYDTNDNDSRSRVSTVSRRASYRPSTQQSDSPRGTRGRRSEPSPTAIRVSRSVTPRGITAARNPQAWAAEGKGKRIRGFRAARRAAREAREASQAETQRLANIKQSVARMRADPLRRTGSSGSDTSSVTREILSQRGLTTVPDNPRFKSLKGRTPSNRRGGGQAAAIQRATAAGLSPAQVERIRRKFSSQNRQRDAVAGSRVRKDQAAQERTQRKGGPSIPSPWDTPPTSSRAAYVAPVRVVQLPMQRLALPPSSATTGPKTGSEERRTLSAAQSNLNRAAIAGRRRLQRLGLSESILIDVLSDLVENGYADNYDNAITILENLSGTMYNNLIKEYIHDSQY